MVTYVAKITSPMAVVKVDIALILFRLTTPNKVVIKK